MGSREGTEIEREISLISPGSGERPGEGQEGAIIHLSLTLRGTPKKTRERNRVSGGIRGRNPEKVEVRSRSKGKYSFSDRKAIF